MKRWKLAGLQLFILLSALGLFAGCGSQAAPVDMDLRNMSEPMAYATVIQIANSPEEYEGKTIRLKGAFLCIHSDALNRDYYSCEVLDEGQCCTEGIEFVLPEGQKYPENGEKITVSGTYELYEEDGCIFGQLRDAVLE